MEQQTLLWDAEKNIAQPMRGKEESHDYRYFPEPDLVPVHIDVAWFDKIKQSLPELPQEKFERFLNQYQLPEYDVRLLTENREVADYFEKVAALFDDFKMISNWMLGEIARVLNEQKISINQLPLKPDKLADLLQAIRKKVVSTSAAKKVFDFLLSNDLSVEQAIEKLSIYPWYESLKTELPKQAKDYINFLAKALEAPVGIVSVGAERDSTFFVRPVEEILG